MGTVNECHVELEIETEIVTVLLQQPVKRLEAFEIVEPLASFERESQCLVFFLPTVAVLMASLVSQAPVRANAAS